MVEADYGLTQQAFGGSEARYEEDGSLFVQFYTGAIQDKEASLKEGRPIFKDEEFIRIMVPGDKENVVERVVRDNDRQRFHARYQAWKKNAEEEFQGTPLDKWNFISHAQVEELRYFGIRTVEQLAGVSDGNAQNFVGINRLRQKAQEYLAATKDDAPIAQLQVEIEKRDSRISEQDETIANLLSRIEALESKGKKKGD